MSDTRKYLRFTVPDRIEHWVQMASFTTLAITGLVQKYATSGLPQKIIELLGGVDNVRIIHHIAAIVMMLGVVYHLGSAGYKFYVRRSLPAMLPSVNDVRAAWQTLLYNLDRIKNKPQQGRYTFEEKFEYWAFVWGTLVMGITGFMMWNPIATTKILPGEYIPAAKAAHGGEALLAVLAILVWHLYNVHIKHLNKSMFTGYLTEKEMLEEHPLELADFKAGRRVRPLDPRALKKRKRVFFPIYGAIAGILLVSIYFFVNFEETAITTVLPAENVVVYAPLTPTPLPTPIPTRTPLPTVSNTWDGGLADLFANRCEACHGATTAISGLNLSTYEGAISGGEKGPVILPGDPDDSLIVIVQSAGNHPGQLSGEELALVRQWIEDGAPEK
ncbi:MAG: cytochrome b/b6 domain-containing protein [Chloroflexota bacterium]